jgi:hypothetical protein
MKTTFASRIRIKGSELKEQSERIWRDAHAVVTSARSIRRQILWQRLLVRLKS